jgi:hypothetical protein
MGIRNVLEKAENETRIELSTRAKVFQYFGYQNNFFLLCHNFRVN